MSALAMARRIVTFRVFGIAQPKGSTKAFMVKGRPFPVVTSDNPKAKGWQQLVGEQAQTVAQAGLFVGPVAVAIVFQLPRPISLPKRIVHHLTAPDIDKLARCCLDGLTGVLYRDDSQVVELRARKVYSCEAVAPCAHITVLEAAPPQAEQTSLPFALGGWEWPRHEGAESED